MSQATDANDAYVPRGWKHAGAQRGVNADAGAHQHRGLFGAHGGRERIRKSMVDDDRRGETTVGNADAAIGDVEAELFLSLETPLAVPAGTRLPADADAVALLQAGGFPAQGRHMADDLVAGNERIAGNVVIVSMDWMSV